LEFVMRTWFVVSLTQLLICACPLGVAAQDRPSELPGVITGGSGNTSIGGVSAARKGDTAAGEGAIVEGSPDVLIDGKPAAVQGDKTGCGGTITSGATGVFVNGKPFVIAGSAAGCPDK
jgi:uncharacterized Zn-binding protein involved in type VI secretion